MQLWVVLSLHDNCYEHKQGAWSPEPEHQSFLFWLGFGSCLKKKEIFWLPGHISRDNNWRSSFRDFFTWHTNILNCACESNRELKQPRRRQHQKPHKFAYLTMKNSIFARFAHAFFIYVLVLSTTWNDQFCSCVDDVSIWWQMFKCCLLMSQALVPI